ncbi:GNAT family N-acetyltransferase [Tissierella sp. P1]|uniref:GNAT family N-acetyltransferase n=1 Tax=Tissierella sp. P1 TaxID=1280483 RepID=UPI000BA15F25|nr:GNAT family N-acetyltransferase [Tissierella sp. P1]OZV11976.1 GNAT family N-acetyltransferase [Tissierella sp. P1]
MNYEVKSLSPELAETFVEYLGNLDFAHAPHWSTCFCRYYHTNCSFEQWQNRTGEKNRAEAIEQIKLGNMKGYLVFDGNKCIGWCNANDVREFKRLEDDIDHIIKEKKVGCIICFVIHPGYRGRGIARLVLKKAIEDFKAQGFDAVIALPIEIKEAPEKAYRGTFAMYKEQGFEEIERHDSLSIMWLEL